MAADFEAWWCAKRERAVCPPEGCPAAYGCARDHGWEPGQPSPPECQGKLSEGEPWPAR